MSYGRRAEGTGFWKGIFAGMGPRVLLTGPERAFSAHMKVAGSCVFARCLSRDPPCRRRRFHKSQPLGRAQHSSREPQQPEGTRCRGQSCSSGTEEWTEREGSPFATSHSDLSFCSSSLLFQLGVLPQDAS